MKKGIMITLVVIVLILAIVGIALVAYINSNYYYSSKLISAIEEENMEEIQQIVEKKPTCINSYPTLMPRRILSFMEVNVTYPLKKACATGNIEMITFLLENGADPNCYDGSTPLSIVYRSKADNWYNISQVLIDHGASLDYIRYNSSGKSWVLMDIVQARSGAALPGYVPENEEEVIEAFHYALNKIDHSNVNWMEVLQHSISNDRIKIVQFLLDEGYCDVNDTSGTMTALMFAARDSTPEMVQLLLDYGADKGYEASDGKTALYYAVLTKNYDVIPLIIPSKDR